MFGSEMKTKISEIQTKMNSMHFQGKIHYFEWNCNVLYAENINLLKNKNYFVSLKNKEVNSQIKIY